TVALAPSPTRMRWPASTGWPSRALTKSPPALTMTWPWMRKVAVTSWATAGKAVARNRRPTMGGAIARMARSYPGVRGYLLTGESGALSSPSLAASTAAAAAAAVPATTAAVAAALAPPAVPTEVVATPPVAAAGMPLMVCTPVPRLVTTPLLKVTEALPPSDTMICSPAWMASPVVADANSPPVLVMTVPWLTVRVPMTSWAWAGANRETATRASAKRMGDFTDKFLFERRDGWAAPLTAHSVDCDAKRGRKGTAYAATHKNGRTGAAIFARKARPSGATGSAADGLVGGDF